MLDPNRPHVRPSSSSAFATPLEPWHPDQAMAPDGLWYGYDQRVQLDKRALERSRYQARNLPEYQKASEDERQKMEGIAADEMVEKRKVRGIHASSMFDSEGRPLVSWSDAGTRTRNLGGPSIAKAALNWLDEDTDDEEHGMKKAPDGEIKDEDMEDEEDEENDSSEDEEDKENDEEDEEDDEDDESVTTADSEPNKANPGGKADMTEKITAYHATLGHVGKGRIATWKQRVALDNKALEKVRAGLRLNDDYLAAPLRKQQKMLERAEKEQVAWRIRTRIHASCFFRPDGVPLRPYDPAQQASKVAAACLRAQRNNFLVSSVNHADDNDSELEGSDEDDDDKSVISEATDKEEEIDAAGTVTTSGRAYTPSPDNSLYHFGLPTGSNMVCSAAFSSLNTALTPPNAESLKEKIRVDRAYGYSKDNDLFHIRTPSGQLLHNGKTEESNGIQQMNSAECSDGKVAGAETKDATGKAVVDQTSSCKVSLTGDNYAALPQKQEHISFDVKMLDRIEEVMAVKGLSGHDAAGKRKREYNHDGSEAVFVRGDSIPSIKRLKL